MMGLISFTAKAAKKIGRGYIWSITGDLDEVKQNFRNARDRMHGMLNREFRHETFEEAIQRLGLSKQDIEDKRRQFDLMAFFYGLLSLLCFLYMLMAPFSPHPIAHGFLMFGVFVVFFTKYIGFRFRIAQIRAQQFFEFKDWLRQMLRMR